MEELKLTQEQLKAAKAVYRAIRKAGKLGVCFWDDYGAIKAFNSNKITCPVPDSGMDYNLDDNNVTYWENLPKGYFLSGNADDNLYFSRV